MGAFDAWIGRGETRVDQVDSDRTVGFHALLDRDCPTPEVLPLLGHWRDDSDAVRRFSFRARASLFDGEAFRLCSDAPDLRIEDSRGATAMVVG
jgi:hydroxyacyl-ACP dehydratase HTD2-like protein with hotdog domain